MLKRFFATALPALLLAGVICTVLPAADVQAKQHRAQAQAKASISPAQAAARAKARYGGKVLKVTRQGNAYRVKLLTDSGRVITVMIKA